MTGGRAGEIICDSRKPHRFLPHRKTAFQCARFQLRRSGGLDSKHMIRGCGNMTYHNTCCDSDSDSVSLVTKSVSFLIRQISGDNRLQYKPACKYKPAVHLLLHSESRDSFSNCAHTSQRKSGEFTLSGVITALPAFHVYITE